MQPRSDTEQQGHRKAANLPADERLMRCPEVVNRVGLSRSAIYARVKAGTFPAPVSTGGNSVAWVASEIDQWISERIAARDAAQ